MKLLIIIFFISQTLYGQFAKDSIAKWTNILNFHPLSKIDTTSRKIPKNISTSSGWNIDFYGNSIYSNRITVATYVYNEKIFYEFEDTKYYNHGQIKYDTIKVFKESEKFLYIEKTNSVDTSQEILIFPKKTSDDFFQFNDLLYSDYDNNIFIEYSSSRCQATEILYLEVTNLNNGKIKEIMFSKGICEGGKNNWCIDKITYQNGTLTILATLTNKRTKKTVIEIQRVEI